MTDYPRLIEEILNTSDIEYKTLGEIATEPMFKGSGIARKDLADSGVPCVRYADIYTTYGVWFDKTSTFADENACKKARYARKGDILFAITGEKVDDIAKSTAYVGEDPIVVGGDIVVLRHDQDPKYLSYALSTPAAQKQKTFGKVKSKVVHSSIPDISKIIIPLPSIEVQQVIVSILDSFSLNIKNMSYEKELRDLQFDYYLHSIVKYWYSRSDLIPIATIAEVSTGSSNKADSNVNGRYPFFVRSATVEHKDDYEYDEKAIIIPGEGGIGDIFHFIDGKYALHQRVYRVHIFDDRILPKFAFYCFNAMFKSYIATETVIATVSSIRKPMVDGFQIPLISQDDQ